jgi:hypothetical protein
MLATDEHDGHKDLRGSDRRSVTLYVHGESCCIAQAWAYECVSVAYHPSRPFIDQAHDSYTVSQGTTGGPGAI